MKKILILGSTGMAGHTITLYFLEQGYDVTAFSNTPFSYCKNIIGDAFDEELVKKMVVDGNYDVIINCIGLLNKTCDLYPEKAVYLNSYLPHYIVSLTKNMKTKYIHMSTDCVFSGKTGPYYENSFKDGETFYDKTKALGEVNDEKNLTFRNSIVGPDMNENGIGLFNWFMKQSGTINGFGSVMWTGVTTLTLAKAMEKAIEEDITGIYNLVNNESISKYDLLNEFKNAFNKEINIVRTDDLKVAKTLINTRKDFSFTVPSYHQMILEMAEWVFNHKELYSHYFGE